MNPILREVFNTGILRFYPYNSDNKIVIRVFESFVIYYIDNAPDSTDLSMIQTDKNGLKCFEFNGYLLPICYSLPFRQY